MSGDSMRWGLSRRGFVLSMGAAAAGSFVRAGASDSAAIAPQPYFAAVNRAVDSMAKLGAPLLSADGQRIAALTQTNDAAAVTEAETILDKYTLARLEVDTTGVGRVLPGGAEPTLIEQGWRLFLVRIANPTGRADRINFSNGLFARTPGRMSIGGFSVAQKAYLMDTLKKGPLIEKMWLMTQMYGATPVPPIGFQVLALSTFAVDYQVIQLFSRDAGKHDAKLMMTMLSQVQGIGAPSSSATFTFDCRPTRDVVLNVTDVDGAGWWRRSSSKHAHDHIYPPQAMRLAPDVSFGRRCIAPTGRLCGCGRRAFGDELARPGISTRRAERDHRRWARSDRT